MEGKNNNHREWPCLAERKYLTYILYLYTYTRILNASRRSSLFPLDVRDQLTVFYYYFFTGCSGAGCGGRTDYTEDASSALYRRIIRTRWPPVSCFYYWFPTTPRRGRLKGRKEKIHTKRIGYNIHRHCSPFDIYCIIIHIYCCQYAHEIIGGLD